MIATIAAGNSGIGQALIGHLLNTGKAKEIHASFNNTPPPAALRDDSRIRWTQTNLTSEADIEAWLGSIDSFDWLVNCAGVLHTTDNGPEKSIREIDPDFFLHNMRVNCLPSLLLAKHAATTLRRGKDQSTVKIFATVSAKVGSIEDNRLGGWHSYRASKAALNMFLKNLSIEWQRQMPWVCVASLHPGTTDTALSKPFQKNVPADSLFDSDYTASRLIDILSSLSPEQSGRFWAWDGSELPW